jgi:DNA-binding SARP family transcriptional activator
MVRLEILGPPRIVDPGSGRPVRCWRSQMALLARLALAPDGVLREDLATLVWPETSADAARRSLRQALFQLRRRAGHLVVGDSDRLRLSPQVATDERQFHALLGDGRGTEALELYRGELLEGLDPPAGTPFEGWLFEERARLERLTARALRDVLEGAATAGEWAAGIRSAERWLATGRFSESAYGFLMRAFAHAGDRARALAVYDELRSRLREELDADVDASLEALADRLRHGEPLPDGRSSAGPACAGVLIDPPFVGRNREFARLSAEWEAARAGHRRFLLVVGEAGGGKTRLVSEFARWTRLSDATVLVGRSYEMERTIPYATLTGLLREALDAPGLAACDPPLLAELTGLVPELTRRFPAAGGRAPARRSRAGRNRLHEAARAVLENLACEQPLLIVIDDLPWADEASRAALHYAWRTLAAAPLLLVATARPDQVEPGTSVEMLLTSLGREDEAAVGRIDLLPLDAPAVAELVRAVRADAAGDPSASRALAHDTGGNPLFVIETLRAGVAGSAPTRSATLRALASDRMAGLSGHARDLLQAGAVLGRRFTLPVARAVAGLDARVAAVAAGELVGRDLLRRSRYHYDFTHELLRQILYEELAPELRAVLHEQAYRWYLSDAQHGTARLEVAATLARHAAEADLGPAAYQWSVRSAELAERLYAGAEAEEYLRQALTFAGSTAATCEVWRRLGDLWRAQARFGKAAVAYLRALPPGASAGGLEIRLRMLDAALRAELVTLPEVRPELRRLVDLAARGGPALRRDALLLAAEAVWRHADLDAALKYARQAVAAAREAGEAGSLVRALLLAARLLARTNRSAGVLAAIEEAARIARQADLLLEWLQADIERGLELYRLGQWQDAERTWRRALAQAEGESEFGSIAVISLNLGDLYLRRGAWQAAEEAFDRVGRLCARFDFPHVAAGLCTNRALLAWHRGDRTAAAMHAQAAIEQASAHGLVAAERSARAIYALTRLDAGDRGEADAEQRAIERLGTHPHSTWADDGEVAVIVRARLSQLQGNRRSAAALLGRAAAAARDRYARLLLEVERAALFQDRARRRARAVALLPELRRLGSRPLIERAERLRDSLCVYNATGFGPAAGADPISKVTMPR